MNTAKLVTVGIDASNLNRGGGVTHLVELLRATHLNDHKIKSILVWGNEKTLNLIEDRPWLKKRVIAHLNNGIFRRMLWQRFRLPKLLRDEGCDVLFVPGGGYVCNFRPVVTMSRNLLPFETKELLRYGLTFFTLRLLLLRIVQIYAFKKSTGVIFLTKYAYITVKKVTRKISIATCIIPHGISARFKLPPRLQRDINFCDASTPFRILYVSIIEQYKHQWHVVEAVSILRKKGLQIALDLVGPAYPPALNRLNEAIEIADPGRDWVHYQGEISYDELHLLYLKADVGIFASSCENMPNILLELMASGLPITCSNRGPMPEVLGDCGIYFDPEKPDSIAQALSELIHSPQLRSDLANSSYVRSNDYSWERCADETFNFIAGFSK